MSTSTTTPFNFPWEAYYDVMNPIGNGSLDDVMLEWCGSEESNFFLTPTPVPIDKFLLRSYLTEMNFTRNVYFILAVSVHNKLPRLRSQTAH